jgi:DNA-binding transcriptional LysR family regulator
MVMRHGSITAAAGVLGVSQPAVSKLIADLEHAVGFTLFLRKGGKAQPTAEALELAQEVERLFFGLDRLELAAREIRDLRHATLRLATMPAISFEVVPEIIRSFLSRYGSVKVAHDVHISGRIADLVSARQFDLGLAQMPVTRRDVDVIASYRMPCVCALPPGHRLSKRASIGPAELAGEPMVALAHHTLTAGHLTQSFLAANIQPTIAVESQPSYAACGLAAVGIGVAIVDPLTPRVFGPERLVTVPFEPTIPFDFHLIKTLDTTLSRAAEAFCEVARDYFDHYAETTGRLHKV